MFAILGSVIAASVGIDLTNRILDEYIIPGRELKRAGEGKVEYHPSGFDLALSKDELEVLHEMGALAIIVAATKRCDRLKDKHQVDTCGYCNSIRR